jgi:hypothetical protein
VQRRDNFEHSAHYLPHVVRDQSRVTDIDHSKFGRDTLIELEIAPGSLYRVPICIDKAGRWFRKTGRVAREIERSSLVGARLDFARPNGRSKTNPDPKL